MTWYFSILLYLWDLVKIWLHTVFVTPYQTLEMLWIIVPIWLSWFFAEFFQEKTGTSMGNAISNSTVIVWAAIDCTRQTIKLISDGAVAGFGNIAVRFGLISLLMAYGILIIVLGWKGNAIVRKIGRVREVTYLFVMFVPVFYNAIPFSFKHILATILIFPAFYFVIELLDKIIPNPKAVDEDNGSTTEKKDDFSMDSFSKPETGRDQFKNDPFAQGNNTPTNNNNFKL
jgi:hypothetical protein